MLVYAMRAAAARYDTAVRTGRAPSELNPADSPSSGQHVPFDTEPEKGLFSLADINDFCDLSWIPQ